MAHIHLIHNADDSDAAERVADVLYFLDYDVNVLTRESPDLQGVSEDTSQDIVLVLWTASAQKDRWLTAQCRDIDNPDRLVTIVSKSSGSLALPLMLHRGCIIRLEHQSGRMRLSTLQTLLAEIGRRTGRDGLVSGVAALLRSDEEERVQALTQWVAANPDDALAPTVESVLQTHATGDIHNAFVEITNGVLAASTGLKNIAGGVAQRVKLPARVSPMMFYAAIGITAALAFLATLLPIINRPTETLDIERIDVSTQMASIADDDLSETSLVDPGAPDLSEMEAVGDAEAEYVIDPLPEPPSVLPRLSDSEELEEPSLGVPDPGDEEIELDAAPASDTRSDAPLETPEDPVEDVSPAEPDNEEEEEAESSNEAEENAEQAELLLPYIPGTQQPGDAFTDRLTDETGAPVMVVIPEGTFKMGSPLSERGRDVSEGPQRTVRMTRSFAVSKYEVTIAEFEKFVAATDYDAGGDCQVYSEDAWTSQDGATFLRTGFDQTPSHPVTCIDWNGASAYAEWLSQETGEPYRLLSEAEWEYAARAGSEQAFPFGADANEACGFMNGADEDAPPDVSSGLALKCSDGAAYTSRAGSYAANGFGLYDMHGNVWEWTRDVWHTSYNGAPQTGRAWDSGQSSERVIRGGSWFTYDFWLRSASRKGFDPADRRYDVGFRVARDL